MMITRAQGLPRVKQIICSAPGLSLSFPGLNMFPISIGALIHHDCRRHLLLHNILTRGLNPRFNQKVLLIAHTPDKDLGVRHR